MLEDPRVNFAISNCPVGTAVSRISASRPRIETELAEVYDRLEPGRAGDRRGERHHLLLRPSTSSGSPPAGRALGDLLHLWRGHRLRRGLARRSSAKQNERAVCCEPSIGTHAGAGRRSLLRAVLLRRLERLVAERPTTSFFSARQLARASCRSALDMGQRPRSRLTAPAAFRRVPCIPWRSISSKSPISDTRAAQQKLGRIRQTRRTGDGFRLHRLRPGRRRSLSGLARQPGDRPLGRAGPRCVRGHRSREKPRVPKPFRRSSTASNFSRRYRSPTGPDGDQA